MPCEQGSWGQHGAHLGPTIVDPSSAHSIQKPFCKLNAILYHMMKLNDRNNHNAMIYNFRGKTKTIQNVTRRNNPDKFTIVLPKPLYSRIIIVN